MYYLTYFNGDEVIGQVKSTTKIWLLQVSKGLFNSGDAGRPVGHASSHCELVDTFGNSFDARTGEPIEPSEKLKQIQNFATKFH